MKNEKPLQKFHIKLVKSTVNRFDEVLEKGLKVSEYDIKAGWGFSGKLYVSPPKQTPPTWLTFVQSGIKKPLKEIANSTNAAVLVVRRKGRMFAFTFGHGRNLLRLSALVPDFGLKTALNCLQHNSLRSLDSFAIEGQTVHTRTQASRAGGIELFGINIGKDILRAVTGTPRKNVPLVGISGTEFTLVVSTRTDFPGLGKLCDDLLGFYQKHTYKDHFSWVDNVRKVKDPTILDKLHETLIEELKLGSKGIVIFSPPEPVDWGDIRCFDYTHNRNINDLEPQIDNYLKKKEVAELTEDDVKKDKVFVYCGGDAEPTFSWSVYSCLSFETVISGKNYLLTSGDWFEIDRGFAKSVDRTLASIPVAKTKLPKLIVDKNGKFESEGIYNARAAQADPSMALLDKKFAKCRSTSSPIEPCDLFTRNNEFIHIKHKKGGSSDLSHLFAQGRISAEALINDEDFRREVRGHLSEKPSLQKAIPLLKPVSGNFIVVFAILGANDSQPAKDLPFFSKLNLARTYDALTSLGFNVAILGVTA